MLRVNGLYGHIRRTYLRSLVLFAGFALALVVLWAGALPALVLGAIGLGLAATLIGLPAGLAKTTHQQAMHALERLPTDFPNFYLETLWIPVALACGWLVVGLWLNVRLIRATFALRPLSRHEEPRLYNIVENLSIAAGLPMPALELIDSPHRNAFAVGLTPETSLIAVSRGLLDGLTPREIEAVMAHELTHIANSDAQVNVVASVLQGSLMWLAAFVWHRLTRHATPLEDLCLTRHDEPDDASAVAAQKQRFAGFFLLHAGVPAMLAANAYDAGVGRDVSVVVIGLLAIHLGMMVWQRWRAGAASRELSTSVLPSKRWLYFWPIWLLMAMAGGVAALAYAIAAFSTAAISRSRELLADAGAIELTKDADALCSALRKVAGRDALPSSNIAAMALMISSSRGGLFATHPPLETRIAAIEAHASDMLSGAGARDPAATALQAPMRPSQQRASERLPVVAAVASPAGAVAAAARPGSVRPPARGPGAEAASTSRFQSRLRVIASRR